MSNYEHDVSIDEAADHAEAQREQAKQNMKDLVSNPKTRPKVLFTFGAIAVFLVLGLILLNKTGKKDDIAEASIDKPAINVDKNVKLNATTSQAYKDLENQDNLKKAEEAKLNGGAHIDLPSTATDPSDNGRVKFDDPKPQTVQPVQPASIQPTQAVYVRDTVMDNGMRQQYQALLKSWGGNTGSFKQVVDPQQQNSQASNGTTYNAQNQQQTSTTAVTGKFINIKAGTIYYATNDIEANTDDPGETLATIRNGPLKGSKLIGGFSKGKQTITLNYGLLSPSWPSDSVTIKAIAIDPDTAKKGMATDVDNHYFLRYGLPLAGAFIQGLGEAAARSATTVSTSPLGATAVTGELSTSNQLMVAAGKAGSVVANDLNSKAQIQPTITLQANQPIAILFLTDTKIPVTNDKATELGIE